MAAARALSAEARATLDLQAAWLARYPAIRATIAGNADERGTREYNLALGGRRANAARVGRCGDFCATGCPAMPKDATGPILT